MKIIATDKYNRLVIKTKAESLEKNTLVLRREKGDLLDRLNSGATDGLKNVKIEGKWRMDEDHNLIFNVYGVNREYLGKEIIFRTEIQRVEGTRILFRVRSSKTDIGNYSGNILLRGRWRADSNNRITFQASKSSGRYDILRLEGAWKILNNELIYRQAVKKLRTKIKKEKLLIFKGLWNFEKNKIIYRLEGAKDSYFSFSGTIASKKIKASRGFLKYNIGIAYGRRRVYGKIKQEIAIHGKWMLRKDLTVSFEYKSAEKKTHIVNFFAKKVIGNSGNITFGIKNINGSELGVEVEFLKAFRDDVDLIMALSKSKSAFSILGEIKLRF